MLVCLVVLVETNVRLEKRKSVKKNINNINKN
jgi:hypothetical protein